MVRTNIDIDNTLFVLLSFEGPDMYSCAGGLGVRITNLSQTLASEGFTTHLFFIGDPHLQGEEVCREDNLILHRWCQWISQYYPAGVYHGENEKLSDYTRSIPPYLLEHIIRPAFKENKLVVVLAEEWHTAEAICNLHRLLSKHNLRDKALLFWNANNTFGFDRINFKDLVKAATITTVSRFMKQAMWNLGINPIVIPNGIPRGLLKRVDSGLSSRLREGINADLILAKIARWDPDKRWNMAIEAAARLKARGLKPLLIVRGGMESYGEEVLYNARSLGLQVKDVTADNQSLDGFLDAIIASSLEADCLNLRFYCSQDLLRVIYHAANAVLANSGKEPFGLVGLETMAAGGIAFTGSTGEDYTVPFYNSIVLETADPKEIETYVLYLASHPGDEARIRKAARYTARRFTWEQILGNIIQRLQCQAKIQGVISIPPKIRLSAQFPESFLHSFSENSQMPVPAGGMV